MSNAHTTQQEHVRSELFCHALSEPMVLRLEKYGCKAYWKVAKNNSDGIMVSARLLHRSSQHQAQHPRRPHLVPWLHHCC